MNQFEPTSSTPEEIQDTFEETALNSFGGYNEEDLPRDNLQAEENFAFEVSDENGAFDFQDDPNQFESQGNNFDFQADGSESDLFAFNASEADENNAAPIVEENDADFSIGNSSENASLQEHQQSEDFPFGMENMSDQNEIGYEEDVVPVIDDSGADFSIGDENEVQDNPFGFDESDGGNGFDFGQDMNEGNEDLSLFGFGEDSDGDLGKMKASPKLHRRSPAMEIGNFQDEFESIFPVEENTNADENFDFDFGW